MPERRVAITGIGPVTPVGIGVDAFWDALVAGRSGIGPITCFDTAGFATSIAGEIAAFDAEEHMDPRRARRLERFSQLALVAAQLALADAGLKPTDLDPSRGGIVIGTGVGALGLAEKEYNVLVTKGPRRVNPAVLSMAIPNAAVGAMAIELGFTGPSDCTVAACAAGAQAIARGVDYIRAGIADVVLAGGTEAVISPFGIAIFNAARALSTRNDSPREASRPFDAGRDGFVMSEGSTMLVLEELEAARARGATVLGEVAGYGLTSDAYNMTTPHPDGAGAAAAMRAAMRAAGVSPDDIGYVNAHATSTVLGDAAEAKALRTVFGDSPPPISATKSMTGHLIGAAGSTEAAITVLAMLNGVLPPTINVTTLDPDCDLDVVPNRAREHKAEVALSNSFGFGGHNVTLVLRRGG